MVTKVFDEGVVGIGLGTINDREPWESNLLIVHDDVHLFRAERLSEKAFLGLDDSLEYIDAVVIQGTSPDAYAQGIRRGGLFLFAHVISSK